MNYFTKEWISGILPDEDFDKMPALYWDHIESILPKLSTSVTELAKEINIHDGLIQKCIFEHQSKELNLVLRCGDLQVGYFDVSLRYSDVRISIDEFSILEKISHIHNVELLYDEVDLDTNANFIHRLIFSSLDEVSITFADLEIIKENRPNRSFPLEGNS